MPTILITDGFTLSATIPESGPFPAIAFSYRPALPEAVDEYLRGPKQGTQAAHRAKFLAKYLTDWDVTENDQPLKPTESALARLPHPHADAMTRYVTCYATDGAHERDSKN